jgi:hypothetical protein
MPIVLFAIIGALIDAGVGYWICFSIYCTAVAIKLIMDVVKKLDD